LKSYTKLHASLSPSPLGLLSIHATLLGIIHSGNSSSPQMTNSEGHPMGRLHVQAMPVRLPENPGRPLSVSRQDSCGVKWKRARPGSPTCSGTATSAAMNPAIPLHKVLVATAVDERPTLASTIYASVLKYIHLYPGRFVSGVVQEIGIKNRSRCAGNNQCDIVM
jgi:hypothetical protein